MQRLQLDPEEKITRKEYLRRKRKQANGLKKRSKITYIVIGLMVVLTIYIFTQYYVYSKENNFKYVAGDDVEKQQVYNVYYVTEGYTYTPVYSLNSINSNGFNDKTLYYNSGLTNVQIDNDYVYGIKDEGIYRLKKGTKELETLIEKDILKYTIDGDRIYYITSKEAKLGYVDLNTIENKVFDISDVSEVIADENNLYVVQDQKTKKILLKFNKDGGDKKELVNSENVSYIVDSENKIFFVNKKDNNKIYSIDKNGENLQKVDDISSVSDKGNIKEIDGKKYMFENNNFLYYINVDDGNTLWKINLDTKEKEKVIAVSVELLQNVSNTVFYKVKGEMGVYLYNYDTKFMSQVTKRKIKEFVVDEYEEVIVDTSNPEGLVKN